MKFFIDWVWTWPDMRLGLALNYDTPQYQWPRLLYLSLGLGPIQVGAGLSFGRELMR